MKEDDVRSILRRANIPYRGRMSAKGWIAFPCQLAPWFHRSGRINPKQADAAVLVDPKGPSIWKCQSCGNTGRLSTLVRQLTRYRDGAANEQLADEAEKAEMGAMLDVPEWDAPREDNGSKLSEPLDEEMYEGTYPLAVDSAEALDYLRSRGITYDTAEKLDLLFDPDDTFRGRDGVVYSSPRVLFPVRDHEAKLYGWTGRDITGQAQLKVKDYFGLPKRHLILGEHRWRPGMPKLIVEGLFGYAHLVEIGAEEYCDIGAILGSTMTDEKAERLRMHGCSTFLLFDNDPAGEQGIFGTVHKTTGVRDESSGAIAKLMGHVPVMVPSWPVYAHEVEREDGTMIEAGTQKVDPDQLTLEDVKAILQTWPYSPPKRPRMAY